ncbi:MAG: GNAT family N-acetyltransferase, partial [Gemmatimonadota bacterium]
MTGIDLQRGLEREPWARFVEQSPQSTVFCHPAFLDALPVRWEVRHVERAGVPVAAAVVLRGTRGEVLSAPHPFTMYQGILLARSITEGPAHRSVPAVLQAITELLAGLEPEGRISLCLHPSFPDLRPFSWFHYHTAALGRFALDLRYTGLVPLGEPGGFDAVLAGVRSVRRQEYRKAKERFETAPSDDLDLLDDLHARTFARQGIERPAEEAALLRAIVSAALKSGLGEMIVARDGSGQVASAAVFLSDHRTTYYLVAANAPEHRNAGTSTLLLLEGARRGCERGLQALDVVGMNSPGRGDFKASFGAVPAP